MAAAIRANQSLTILWHQHVQTAKPGNCVAAVEDLMQSKQQQHMVDIG